MDMNIILYKALMNNGCALQVICTYTQTSYVLVQYEYIYLYKYMLVPTIHGLGVKECQAAKYDSRSRQSQ